jgi:hypothetical protein
MTAQRLMAKGLIVVAGVVVGLSVSAGPAAAGETLSSDEKAMLALMSPSDRARYVLQERIQERAETAALLSQLQSLRHDTAMSAIDNIR